MEPVFMILGQSAGRTAVVAIDQDAAVQDVHYEQLSSKTIRPRKLKGIVIDDTKAAF